MTVLIKTPWKSLVLTRSPFAGSVFCAGPFEIKTRPLGFDLNVIFKFKILFEYKSK
jgi:hypothetical protein